MKKTQPEKILAYLNDKKNSMPESPDLMENLDNLNERDYIAFYKEILMYNEPKLQSTTVKHGGDKPEINI